jgi:hypothetical protein
MVLLTTFAKEKWHKIKLRGKEDFIQDYCIKRERLNSTSLKPNVGEFLRLG